MTIKIVAYEPGQSDNKVGVLDMGDHYMDFHMVNGVVSLGTVYPKSDYKDYETFAGVMGKFDPYTVFLETPVPITALTRVEIDNAFKSLV